MSGILPHGGLGLTAGEGSEMNEMRRNEDQLRHEVAELQQRVRELEAENARLATRAEEQLGSVFERVTDAFVALDHDWRYIYLNRKAGELFGRRPEDLIGKHIWTEFPSGVGQPFQLAYERAMREQRAIHLEEYYAPWDRWFENIIYPSPEGLSIYFHDVTDRKRVEEELRKRNRALRALGVNDRQKARESGGKRGTRSKRSAFAQQPSPGHD